MQLLAGAEFAWCAVYSLMAAFFSIFAARRSAQRVEYGLFAAICLCAAVFTFCRGCGLIASSPIATCWWGWWALVAAAPIMPLLLHISALFAELGPQVRRVFLAIAYSSLSMVLGAHAAGGLLDHHEIVRKAFGSGRSAFEEPMFRVLPGHMVFQLGIVVLVATSIGLMLLACRRGKPEAVFACLGGVAVLAFAVYDSLVLHGVVRGVLLSEHGFSVFAFGMSYALLGGHVRRAELLSIEGAELQRRAKELHRSYEQLRAAQKELVRKEQLAVIGELAAVVSHEVRNPLAVIANAVAGLRRPDTTEADRRVLLGILEEEAQRLNRLVGDLLGYARPVNVERKPVDLSALVSRAAALALRQGGGDAISERMRLLQTDFRSPIGNVPRVGTSIASQHGGTGIELRMEPAEAPLPEVRGDPNLIRQVFDNLVQNACQAMPDGGTLLVRVVSAEEDGTAGVAIQISDTGEGMDTQVRSRARTPFFTTREGGTGLGLAICDRIVTAHGGILSIVSRAGEGTTVRVFLPAAASGEPIASGTGAMPSTWLRTPAALSPVPTGSRVGVRSLKEKR